MRSHLSKPIWVLALLFVALFAGSRPAMARPPSQVELSGEFEIIRDSDDPCQISVPTKITGTLTLKIDYIAGTAEGSLQGSGSGSDVVPAGLPSQLPCSDSDGMDVYRAETSFTGVISRDAYDVLTDSDLVGSVDGTTGEFVVYAIIEIEGSGSHGVPGSTYYCAGSSGQQSECPIGEIVSPQPATITGRVVTGEVPTLAIDWYTNYCGRVEGDTIRWGRTGCPTGGSSTPGVVSFVPAPNSSPVITSLTLDNPEPYTGDTVAVTVDATDPDGDPLTYSWTVTDLLDSDGSTATWRPETAQTYTIVVRVEDDIGGVTEESTTVTVIDPAPVTTAEPVEESVAVTELSEDTDQLDETDSPDPGVEGSSAGESDGATGAAGAEPAEEDAAESAAESETSEDSMASEREASSEPKGKRWSATVWMILLLGLVAGAVGVWIAMKGAIMLRGSRGPNPLLTQPREVARAIEKEWQEGVTDPSPSFIEYPQDREMHSAQPAPVPPPIVPPTVSATSSPVVAPPAGFAPNHEIVLGGPTEYGRAPAHDLSGATVTLLDAGHKVEVVSQEGEKVIARINSRKLVRIDKRNVRPMTKPK